MKLPDDSTIVIVGSLDEYFDDCRHRNSEKRAPWVNTIGSTKWKKLVSLLRIDERFVSETRFIFAIQNPHVNNSNAASFAQVLWKLK